MCKGVHNKHAPWGKLWHLSEPQSPMGSEVIAIGITALAAHESCHRPMGKEGLMLLNTECTQHYKLHHLCGVVLLLS